MAYDPYGKRILSRDPSGFITSYEYDLATGAVIRKVEDVDVRKSTRVPAHWAAVAEGGAHLVTDYVVDDQGRTTRTLGPEHMAVLDACADPLLVRTVQFTVYRDDLREVWSFERVSDRTRSGAPLCDGGLGPPGQARFTWGGSPMKSRRGGRVIWSAQWCGNLPAGAVGEVDPEFL